VRSPRVLPGGKFERERCDMNTITITKKKEQSYFNTSASALYSFDDDEGKSDVLDVLIVVVVFIVLLLSIVLMNECVEQAAVFPKEEGRKERKREKILFRVCVKP
jgi:hypothetical protein